MKKEKYEIQEIPAQRLEVDRSYQRDPSRAHYRKIAESLDFDALGVFVVSKRGDGRLVIIDGQHRLMALQEAEVDEWEVVCRVYSGLSLKREAEMYRDLNSTRKTTAWDDYKAGLVQGDPECVAIENIVSGCGWKVSNQSSDGSVCCVSTLRSIFRGKGGASALAHSLEDVTIAWGKSAAGVERNVLHGMATIHATFGDKIDRPAFTKKLAKYPGGPAGILGKARNLRDMVSKPIYRLCGDVMCAAYNKGRRSGQLGEV